MTKIKLDCVEDVLEDLKKGKMVIVVDDEARENEGDFIIAAEYSTPEAVNFMAIHGRGLICVALSKERCDDLDLYPMLSPNTSLHNTNFAISVDLKGQGCTTGISAFDRSKTILALADTKSSPSDFARPGHVFPLIAAKNGLNERQGHTEAAVVLMQLAGLEPAAAICEIMRNDGSMARLDDLYTFAQTYSLRITTVQLIQTYLTMSKGYIKEYTQPVKLPTPEGLFHMRAFKDIYNKEHAVLTVGSWSSPEPIMLRLHSSCVTGDIFHSLRCDCGQQLHKAMEQIQKYGKGAILYMNQEGRDIGLVNKIKAYKLQEEGLDTVESNSKLGFLADHRSYEVSIEILKILSIKNVILLTNNPAKNEALILGGIQVKELRPLLVPSNEYNELYLRVKKNKMGHNL